MRRTPVLWVVAGGVTLGVFLGLRGDPVPQAMPLVGAPDPTEATSAQIEPLEPPVDRKRTPPEEAPNVREHEVRDPPVPVTLEGLAQLALRHEASMTACFEDAYRSQRLRKGRVHIRMQAGRSLDGQTRVHVTVPDTDEHLYDAEACLNRILGSAALSSLGEDQETGVMWGLTLPTDQWAEDP